jgi:hypothetical protein
MPDMRSSVVIAANSAKVGTVPFIVVFVYRETENDVVVLNGEVVENYQSTWSRSLMSRDNFPRNLKIT